MKLAVKLAVIFSYVVVAVLTSPYWIILIILDLIGAGVERIKCYSPN